MFSEQTSRTQPQNKTIIQEKYEILKGKLNSKGIKSNILFCVIGVIRSEA